MVGQKSTSDLRITGGIGPDRFYQEKYDNRYNSFGGGILAGYLLAPCGEHHPLRLGVEVYLRADHQRMRTEMDLLKDEFVAYRDTISFPLSAGARFRAGIAFGEDQSWFLYGFVGGMISKMTWLRTSFNPEGIEEDVFVASLPGIYSPVAQVKSNALAFEAGIGLEREIWKGHRIGLDCTRVVYDKRSFYAPSIDRDYFGYKSLNHINRVSLRYVIPIEGIL